MRLARDLFRFDQTASAASVTAMSVLICGPASPAGAVYQVQGQAHAAAAPPACKRPSGSWQGRLSALCPIRVQQGLPRARFRWSVSGGAAPSGAVSAGSNPAGGTKFERLVEIAAALLPALTWRVIYRA